MTVWAVELGQGSDLQEIKGSLDLEREALVFAPRDERWPELRIRLAEVTKVRRLRGSPVLMVLHGEGPEPSRTAFYFVQPPPLDMPPTTNERPGLVGFSRNTKRKARRRNVGYLGASNKEKKAILVVWEQAVREAVVAARRNGGGD